MMKRVWRISDKVRAELIHERSSAKFKTLIPPLSNHLSSSRNRLCGEISVQARCLYTDDFDFPKIIDLFIEKPSTLDNEQEKLVIKVSELRDELVDNSFDLEKIIEILNGKAVPLFRSYSDCSASIELFNQLRLWPQLSLEDSEKVYEEDDDFAEVSKKRIVSLPQEQALNETVEVFFNKGVVGSYILFAEFYTKELARPLLFGQSGNDDHERSIILSSKLKGMQASLPGIDSTITLRSTGFWPSYKPFDLNLPAEMVKCVEALGICNGKFDQKTIELIVATYQASRMSTQLKDRRYATDALIVQVLGHQQLVMEFFEKLNSIFKSDFKDIKKRIEDLITTWVYLERDKDNLA